MKHFKKRNVENPECFDTSLLSASKYPRGDKLRYLTRMIKKASRGGNNYDNTWSNDGDVRLHLLLILIVMMMMMMMMMR